MNISAKYRQAAYFPVGRVEQEAGRDGRASTCLAGIRAGKCNRFAFPCVGAHSGLMEAVRRFIDDYTRHLLTVAGAAHAGRGGFVFPV